VSTPMLASRSSSVGLRWDRVMGEGAGITRTYLSPTGQALGSLA
jgi:hypothetical protein